MQEKNLLLIFTRNPELGKVKSRLAKGIGKESALEVYKILLQHTVTVTQDLEIEKSVWYSESIGMDDIWDHQIYDKRLQEGGDLGARMEHAFKDAFDRGYQKVIIIGSDLYDLTTTHLIEAFSKLSNHDAVVGPAKDGGYYLLGMNSLVSQVFKNKNWGNDSVLADTLVDLEKYNTYLLETLNDIDYVEDLDGYEVFKRFLD